MKATEVFPMLAFLFGTTLSFPTQVLSDQKFDIKLNKQKVGEEIIYQEASKKDPNEITFYSKTKLSIQGMNFSIEQEEKLGKDNWSFSKYSLKADVMGQYQEEGGK